MTSLAIPGGPMIGAGAAIGSSLNSIKQHPLVQQVFSTLMTPVSQVGQHFGAIWEVISRPVSWIIFLIAVVFVGCTYGPTVFFEAKTQLNEQGVSNAGDVITTGGEVIDDGLGTLSGNSEQASDTADGTYVESTEFEEVDYDLGVIINDVTAYGPYKIDSPLRVDFPIEVNAIPGTPINVKADCGIVDRTTDEIISQGTIKPKSTFYVNDKDTYDVTCIIPEGSLRDGSNKIIVSTEFNYRTDAELRASFMDQDGFNAIRDLETDAYFEIDQNPLAENTPGPIKIGIGANSFPIKISKDTDWNILPTLRISFTDENNRAGSISKLEKFALIIPKGIDLDCTYNTYSTTNEDGQKVVLLTQESIDAMNYQLKNDKNNWISEGFTCQMIITNREQLLGGVSAKEVRYHSISAYAEYIYKNEESKFISVTHEDGELVTSIYTNAGNTYNVNKNDIIDCESYVDKKQVDNEKENTYSIQLIRNGEVVDNENGLLSTCTYNQYYGRSTCSVSEFDLLSNFGSIQSGDKIKCSMNVILTTGQPVKGTRYASVN
jgi:hypothetical protein